MCSGSPAPVWTSVLNRGVCIPVNCSTLPLGLSGDTMQVLITCDSDFPAFTDGQIVFRQSTGPTCDNSTIVYELRYTPCSCKKTGLGTMVAHETYFYENGIIVKASDCNSGCTVCNTVQSILPGCNQTWAQWFVAGNMPSSCPNLSAPPAPPVTTLASIVMSTGSPSPITPPVSNAIQDTVGSSSTLVVSWLFTIIMVFVATRSV